MTYPPQPNPGQPAQPGYPAQPGQPYAQQQPAGYQGPGPGAAPRPNPFAGTPVIDFVRDGAAVILLLLSLALPWRVGGDGLFSFGVQLTAGRIDVLLITLLSVLSVAISYLARAGVLGAAMPATKVVLIRSLANAPYLIIVLLYIVFDAAQIGGIGIGTGAAVGLTGALLAALPRKYEVYTPEFSNSAGKLGYWMVLGLAVFAALTALLGLIFTIVGMFKYDLDVVPAIGGFISSLVPVLAAVALAGFVVLRSETARIIGVAAGFGAVLAAFILSLAEQSFVETLHSNFGYATLIFAIGAAIYTNSCVPFAMRRDTELNTWYAVLKVVPTILMVGAGLIVIVAILNLIASKGSVGYSVGVLVCAVLAAAAAFVLRMQVLSNLLQSRTIIAAVAGGIVVIAFVAIILVGVGYSKTLLTYDLSDVLLMLLVPAALILYALYVPKEMRTYFASAPAAPAAQYGWGQAEGAMPEAQAQVAANATAAAAGQGTYAAADQPAAAPAAPASGAAAPLDDAARAADPNTPAAELHAMTERRELWPALAANPALYPELREWLASTGDPAVAEALAKNPAAN